MSGYWDAFNKIVEDGKTLDQENLAETMAQQEIEATQKQALWDLANQAVSDAIVKDTPYYQVADMIISYYQADILTLEDVARKKQELDEKHGAQ